VFKPKINSTQRSKTDIYNDPSYLSLYERSDRKLFEYEYTEGDKKITFLSLKTPIPNVPGFCFSETLFDLESPFGYSGPSCNTSSKPFLIKAFASYRSFCQSEKVICEFLRFNPLNPLVKFPELFDFFIEDRRLVSVNLCEGKERRWSGYTKKARNIIRRANEILEFDPVGVSVDEFLCLYNETMRDNEAAEGYYFDKRFVCKLLDDDRVRLYGVRHKGLLVSSGIFFFGDKQAFYHLSGNHLELKSLNGNYVLLDKAFDEATKIGVDQFILGGGRSNSANDQLFKFKSKFSKHTVPFFVGGLTFMPSELAKIREQMTLRDHKALQTKKFQFYRH